MYIRVIILYDIWYHPSYTSYDIVTVTVTCVTAIISCHVMVIVVTVICDITLFSFTKSKIRKEIERIEKNQSRKIRET